MRFDLIDKESWPRREYFEHYFQGLPCTYSMTVKLDITPILERGYKLYPAMLHTLTAQVNCREEFRTAFNSQGQLGIYSEMLPSYTVFHPATETFSNLWTEYSPDYGAFLAAYERDRQQYGQKEGICPKPGLPENNFPVSMVPWASFEGFNLNLQKGYGYLLPIFTMGRYQKEGGKTLMPLAAQVHHGVCDGFHLCRFLRELQERIDCLPPRQEGGQE